MELQSSRLNQSSIGKWHIMTQWVQPSSLFLKTYVDHPSYAQLPR